MFNVKEELGKQEYKFSHSTFSDYFISPTKQKEIAFDKLTPIRNDFTSKLFVKDNLQVVDSYKLGVGHVIFKSNSSSGNVGSSAFKEINFSSRPTDIAKDEKINVIDLCGSCSDDDDSTSGCSIKVVSNPKNVSSQKLVLSNDKKFNGDKIKSFCYASSDINMSKSAKRERSITTPSTSVLVGEMISSGNPDNSPAKSSSDKSVFNTPVSKTSVKRKLNYSTDITPPKKSKTPLKSLYDVIGKSPCRGSPSSSHNSPEAKIKYSPQINRTPSKYFGKERMPEGLIKSPAKNFSPKKKTTPRKKNLMKDFDEASNSNQMRIDYYYKDVSNNSASTSKSADELLNDKMDVFQEAFHIIDDEQNLLKIMDEYKSSQTSPNKKTNSNHQMNFAKSIMHYLVSNPMMTCAVERNLFKSEFKSMMKKFQSLSDQCQMMYTRLFGRTLVWYRVDELIEKYNDSFTDIKGILATLNKNNFISKDLSNIELMDLLKLLKVKELKAICKHFKVSLSDRSEKKENLMVALVKHACSQKVLFGNLTNTMKARVIKELDHCICLNDKYKEFFYLLVILATYPYYRDEEKKRLSNLMFRQSEIKSRKISFPQYVVRQDVAFKSFLQLSDYANAVKLVSEYSEAVENKQWASATQIVIEVKKKFEDYLVNKKNQPLLQNLGGHLLKFTAGHQFCYCLSDGISVLKKDSQSTEECLKVLNLLLSQPIYLQKKRGVWYDELALVYTRNKELAKACRAVIRGLEDDKVDDIRKRMLSQRARSLIKRKSNEVTDGLKAQLSALMIPEGFKPENYTIVAKCQEGETGRKQVFYRDSEDGKTYSSVEEIVIDHYKNSLSSPYLHGLHDEGRTIMNLILCCFYDIVYSHPEGDSVFHCDMQTHPLDWGGRHFYQCRSELIQGHLDRLKMGGVAEIMSVIENVCSSSENVSSVVNWNYISSEKMIRIKGLLECLGHHVFLNIAEHVIKDYKTYHSGFPDLVMWDPPTNRCLLIEVKGPNDKLSASQTVWLENLSRFGAKALVCHVESLGNSRKRKVT